jgi:hypothetical protein
VDFNESWETYPAAPLTSMSSFARGMSSPQGDGKSEDHPSKRWKLDVHVPEGRTTQLQPGPALACGVAIVEKDDPAGLESFSWVQEVQVRRGSLWTDPPPIDFSEAKLAVSAGGNLAAAQAIASSLAIRPSDGEYRWAYEVEIRAVEEALIE